MTAQRPIATITLGSSASSVEFSSIPQNYRDLVLVFSGQTQDDSTTFLTANINNDLTSSYSFLAIAGRFSGSVFTEAFSDVSAARLSVVARADNEASGVITTFFDYSATDKYKTYISRGMDASSIGATEALVGRWENVSAINLLKIQSIRGIFSAGSTFSLYGIEG